MLALVAALTLTSGEPEVSLARDGVLTLGTLGAWLALYGQEDRWPRTRCPCSRDEVSRLDRWAIDEHWGSGERAANVVAAGALALPALVLSLDPESHLASDLLLVAESASLAGLATETAKLASSRPYPYLHRATHTALDGDPVNYAAFWSGHTAVPMAAGVTLAALIGARYPSSPWRWLVYVVAPTLALAAGALQVAASNHYPSDVVAGAVAGALTGGVNVWLHSPQ